MADQLLDKLNDEQRKAVTAPLGPTLVLAGAGSGKTRVLTYRIAYLIREGIFAPQDILALTFTNKAAGEMKERIEKLVGQRSNVPPEARQRRQMSITMGTFHSVGVRILRQDIEKLGVGYNRNFVIFDEADRSRLLKQIVIELGLEESYKYQVFGYYISAAKNRLIHPSKLYLENNDLQDYLEQVYVEYDSRMRSQNALDFDDLLKLVCDLFGKKDILKKYQDKFKYILVDEYQDTNHAQYFLLKKLAAGHKNIFVVGDDAQSIYGFRGANMQNILNFKKDYPKAKMIMLEQNYRSTQSILDAAHEVIQMNSGQFEKRLWTENSTGEKIYLYEAVDEVDEAEFAVRQILGISDDDSDGDGEDNVSYHYDDDDSILSKIERLKSMGKSRRRVYNPGMQIPDDLSDTVILYRTHAQSRAFEEGMLSYGIPYQIVGGIKFYERQEIKDALAFLRLLINPKDLVSLSRVINLPAKGIGAKSFREIKNCLQKFDSDFVRVRQSLSKLDLTPRAADGAEIFFNLYEEVAGYRDDKNILDVLERLLVGTGYKEYLLKLGEEGLGRWENIEELFNVAGKYRQENYEEGIKKFLEETALMTDLDQVEDSKNRLTMMTLHSAKGLEFNKVFFVGLEEGLLPHERSMMNPEELAEEVRLAYVGITRARERLFLSYARQRSVYGDIKQSVPSRILKSIPESLLRKISR